MILADMQEFSSHGVRIAYLDAPPAEGEKGRPVLLIHGFASNHAVNWVFPQWLKTLNAAGRRVVAFDNRGHGRSEKLYRPEDYELSLMAADARNLLDHLGIEAADIMGYSLGARIATAFALAYPERAKAFIFGGLGGKLLETPGLGEVIARALEAPSLADVEDGLGKTFRALRRGDKKRPSSARRLRPRRPASIYRGGPRRDVRAGAGRGRHQGRCGRGPAGA